MAEAMDGEFYVVYVDNDEEMPEQRRRSLEGNLQFAQNVGASIVRLKGSSIPLATAEYVSKNRITQVIFGRSAVKGWKKYLYYHALQKFMTAAPHVDVAYCDAAGEVDSRARMRILIVDDEPQITRVLRTSLQGRGTK